VKPLRKPSFYEWITTRTVDGLIRMMELFSRRVGQHSFLSRLQTMWKTTEWQYVFWTLFIVVFLHVYVLLFLQKLVLIIALDILIGGLLVVIGPERLWRILRSSIPGKLLAQLFDPNK
jgi:hypothetical protein